MRRDVNDYDLVDALRLDGGAGPALPINDAAAAAIIGGALERAFGAPGGGGGGGAGGGAGGFGAKLAGGVLAAAAVAGIVWWIVKPDERMQRAASVPIPVAPAAEVLPLPPEEKAPIPEVEVVIPVPAPEKPARPREEKPVAEPTKSVEDLMAEANAARKAKQWKKADALYLEVVRDHAKSASAQVALVASATLHLEHLGDPKGALQRFRAAIGRVSGPLAEEARYGLAEAHRALGDDAAEAKALDDFLRHHADSPLADRARSRRGEL
jgi:tetratricopeptide (TPR) repeat protein